MASVQIPLTLNITVTGDSATATVAESSDEHFAIVGKILKSDAPADAESHFVLGVVLEPLTPDNPDAQADWYTPADIENAAHGYMKSQALNLMHRAPIDGVDVVESYLAPVDFEMGGEKVLKGSWVMGVEITNPELWEAIRAGAINAFSIEGSGMRVDE